MQRAISFFRILFFILFFSSCPAQKNGDLPATKKDRQAYAAGSFYPGEKNELEQMLSKLFKQAPEADLQNPMALIVPHAGYVFSGSVAAAAYKQIDPNRIYKHIFIIGSSHTMNFDGASVYSSGDFITPLGKVIVDTLAASLDKKYDFISCDPRPHAREHSIEVQLPFLQYWLKNKFSIVPIILGGESEQTCRNLADALTPYFNEDNLFVISSDFSHYPSYADAEKSDKLMADAILSNSPAKFMDAKHSDESRNVPGLVTALCGWTSVLTLLDITEKNSNLSFKSILHRNSGDTEYGDKDRVVGYYAIGVTGVVSSHPLKPFKLTDDDKLQLLKLARKTVLSYVSKKEYPELDAKVISPDLMIPAGAFVTLKENGELRGCIGNFEPSMPLYKMIMSMAVASSTEDYRFKPVSLDEIPKLEIEISVLTPMRKIAAIDEIEMGKHGIYIKKGSQSGTFLPQVAIETGWSKEEFLGHCARDKAFIGWNGWKDAEIYIYEAVVFEEKDFIK